MRWVKHMTRSRIDERLSALIDNAGIEGYGFWWLLVEVIAEQMDESDKCSVTYSLPQWSRLLYSHHHKVSNLLGKLEVTGLIQVEKTLGKIEVKIPNLLKYRDEYSKKSGQRKDKNPERVRSKIIDTDTDTDTDKEESKTFSLSADKVSPENEKWISKKKRNLEGKRLDTFKRFWEAFGYKSGRAEAIDAWLDIPQLTEAMVTKIVDAAGREARARPEMIQQGRTPKMAQGWLTARRWEDEQTPAVAATGTKAESDGTYSPVTSLESERLKRALAQYES